MRILIGTQEIVRQIDDLAAGFRALGHEVTTVTCARNPQHPDLTYDLEFDMREAARQTQAALADPVGAAVRPPEHLRRVRELIDAHDVFVFQFASSLLPANLDYRLIRQAGKRLVVLFVGSDAFEWSSAQPVCRHYGYEVAEMYFHPPHDNLQARLRGVREAERWADVVCTIPHYAALFVRPTHHLFLATRMDRLVEHVPGRERPVLVHAPTRRGFKGTQAFLDACDRLRGEGVAFDLRLLEGVPHAAVADALRQADVCLDQLNAPYHGALSLEAMASGCAVVAGSHPEYAPYHAAAPVWNATEATVYERLRELLASSETRRQLARRGRAYVQARHDHVRVARYLLDRLAPHATPHYWPTFYARRYALPEGTSVPPPLRALTTQIADRFGLPSDADLASLEARGLADAAGDPSRPLVGWSRPDAAVVEARWGWSPDLTRGPSVSDPEGALSTVVARACELAALGRAAETAGLHAQAVALAEAHADLQQSPRALTLLGRLARETGQRDVARALWQRAHRIAPTAERTRALEALA